MQGGHGYGGYGGSPPQGYGYGGYGGYGYDAGGYNSGAAAGGYYSNNGYPSYEDALAGQTMKAHESAAPLNELEFQPSETCPKNYVIFDQTCTKSRVMFHPSLANKFGGNGGASEYDNYYGAPGSGGNAYDAAAAGKSMYNKDRDYDADMSCSVRHKEDTDEIDALLCSDDGDEDDVVSTGRTPGYRDGSSPDSCSSSYGGGSKSRSECTGGRKKKERMKKMVRTLKGIIPGGNQMDTPAVLDEAVKYLKSLKVEVKKLGVRGSDS